MSGPRFHYIADRAAGRDNNFNLLRMLAATGVLVSHAYPLSLGAGAPEPLAEILNNTTLGTLCVMVFFAISGFFISRSFAQRRSLVAFFQARTLRLFPALAVVLALTILVAAVFTSASPGRFWTASLEYFLRNMTLFFLTHDLPGIFEQNPFGPAINGSLWTLNYEVLCYFGVALCGMMGLLWRPALFVLALAVFLVAYAVAQMVPVHPRLGHLTALGLPFVIGMSFWVWRAHVPLSPMLAVILLILSWLSMSTPMWRPCFVLALSYAIFVLGYARIGILEEYNRLGDYSYGTYVYAFPIQQTVAAIGIVSPLLNMVIALPFTLLCAVISWHLIEAPALRFRAPRYARMEESGR